jgi:hypothetical protein
MKKKMEEGSIFFCWTPDKKKDGAGAPSFFWPRQQNNPYYAAKGSAASQIIFKNLKKSQPSKPSKVFFFSVSISTMDESALCADILLTESSSSLRVNENGGIYHLGATFTVVDKHCIGALYKRLQREHRTVSSRFLAKMM